MFPGVNADLFKLNTLTAAINAQPYKPGRLGELGIFEEQGVATTTVMIEQVAGELSLVQTSRRGAAGAVVKADKASMRSFIVPHLQTGATIMADELQGVRLFGTENQSASIEQARNQQLQKMRNFLEATIEFHRVGALKGLVIDADGSTIHDLFTEFGVSQQTLGMALGTDTTKIRGKCDTILTYIENALGAAMPAGYRAFCGATFWSTLVGHPKIEQTYMYTQQAADIRGNPLQAFDFGGISWERYRGTIGSNVFVAADEAYVVPIGVPGLFITRYAPADYIETVNQLGLPLYAKAVADEMGKGIEMEAQTNPLNICTRPRAIIKLTTT